MQPKLGRVGKKKREAKLLTLVAPGETILWSGVLVQSTQVAEGTIRVKTQSILTENALVSCSLRDLTQPIRFDFADMSVPRVSQTGLSAHFSVELRDEPDTSSDTEVARMTSLAVSVDGVPAAFIDKIVQHIPDVAIASPLIARRYSKG